MIQRVIKAICDGKTNLDNACHRTYTDDKILYRGAHGDRIETFSNGTCIAPNSCANCNDGFYNDMSGHCSICPKIDHCKHRRCTTVSDNHCEYCDGEIKDKLYWRAYTRHKDSLGNEDLHMKNCIQTCSWRKDSTRCYPGRCDNETAASCECNDGFGGKHCQTITRDTAIAFASIKLRGANPTDDPVETPDDPNDPIPRDTKWTKNVLINQAMLQVTANFKVNMTANPPSKTGDKHFITDFKYGITKGIMKLALIRGS
ncbi:unnamed protein product [Mytilus coruscus]|uniref:EGF-like domain-containing protein n=1 Tax=Mytilus coruscus TaxID=42192 RepID=A0A6J8BUA7_MYTCO|nr:unnamed protein product [Mytilus coruscus]